MSLLPLAWRCPRIHRMASPSLTLCKSRGLPVGKGIEKSRLITKIEQLWSSGGLHTEAADMADPEESMEEEEMVADEDGEAVAHGAEPDTRGDVDLHTMGCSFLSWYYGSLRALIMPSPAGVVGVAPLWNESHFFPDCTVTILGPEPEKVEAIRGGRECASRLGGMTLMHHLIFNHNTAPESIE